MRPSPREDLNAYLRLHLRRAAVGLLGLTVVLAVVGKLFEAELLAMAQAVYAALGVPGLALGLFVTDAIFSPIPPDVFLIVVARSSLHEWWPVVLPAIGVLSAAAGNVGWAIGSYSARFRWAAPYVARVRVRYEDHIRRFDRWAVALGALTPLPFSLMCISAGALGMPWQRMAPVTLLRIPRFVLFYWVVYYSTGGA